MSLHTSAAALPLLLFFIGFACLMVTNAATNVPGKIVYAAPLNDSDSPASPFQDLFPIDSDLSGVGLSSKVLPQSAPGACDAAVIRKETRDKIIAECFSTEVEQKLTICRPSCMAAVRSYWFGFNGVASLCKGVVVAKRKDGEGNPTGGEVTADNLGGFILTAMTMQCVYDYIPSQCGDYPGIGLDLNSVHARMGSAWPQSTAGHSGIHKENYENFKLAACEFCVIEWLARLGQVERMAPELSYFGRSDAEDWPSFRTMLNGTCTSQWEVADALYRQSWNK